MTGPIPKERAEQLSVVEFGLDCQQFLDSKIGRYLVSRAEQDVEEGVQALKEVDAADVSKVRQIQSDIKRAESFMYWMAEAITAGTEAIAQLREAEQTDQD